MDGVYSDHIATLRLTDFFIIMTLLNATYPSWYSEFPYWKKQFDKILPTFSTARESFTYDDLQRVWQTNGENTK